MMLIINTLTIKYYRIVKMGEIILWSIHTKVKCIENQNNLWRFI